MQGPAKGKRHRRGCASLLSRLCPDPVLLWEPSLLCDVSSCLHPLSLVLQDSPCPLTHWALKAVLCLPVSSHPLAQPPQPSVLSFATPSPYLSAFPSWPLALAPAPAPAPSRTPGAPRAAGASGRIAASSGTGAGALAPGQEAWSAVREPGIFCSTRKKGSWAQAGGRRPCHPDDNPSFGRRVRVRHMA